MTKLMTVEHKKAVMNQDIEYFKPLFCNSLNNKNIDLKDEILTYALVKCKIKVMMYLMDNGVQIKPHDINLRFILEKKKDVKILDYLESKGVDLTVPAILWITSIKNNAPYTKYFADKIKDTDSENVHTAIIQVLHANSKNLSQSREVLLILFAKITSKVLEKAISKIWFKKEEKEENESYIQKLYLEANLSSTLSSNITAAPFKL